MSDAPAAVIRARSHDRPAALPGTLLAAVPPFTTWVRYATWVRRGGQFEAAALPETPVRRWRAGALADGGPVSRFADSVQRASAL
jgi:hypothetical protein